MIKPVKRDRISKAVCIGFDTEYTSKTGTLLSFQLHNGERGIFCEVSKNNPMTVERIYEECCRLHRGNPREFTLVTYFSPAELQFMPVEKALNLMEYSKKSTDCTFRVEGGSFLHVYDVFRWFDGQSLAKASKAMGLKKLDQDTKNMTRKMNNSKKGKQYAIHDAYLSWALLHQLRTTFIENASCDPLIVKTPASASAYTFRKQHVEMEYYCDRNKARRCAMLGTWGGRAEVFRRGKLCGTYMEFDFTSAYPKSVIALNEMPHQGCWKEFSRISQTKKMIGGFCHVRFRFPKGCRYPSLPVTLKQSTIYPLSGESHCTLQEIRHSLDRGCRITILDGWGYVGGTTVLRDYIQWTLEERKKAVGAAKIMYKLLGNSIIGKLAQRIFDVSTSALFDLAERLDCTMDDILDLTRDELYALGVEEKPSVGPIFMPEWNGLITGYTRAALAEMIETGDAVYCHTDSVWTKKKPKCELLPFEKKGSGNVTIVRARLAAIGGTTRKEVFGTKKKKPTTHMPQHSIWNRDAARKVIRRFDGNTLTTEYETRRPLSFKEAIAAGEHPYTWRTETRKASTFWDEKRELLSNGDTIPWASPVEYVEALKRAKL